MATTLTLNQVKLLKDSLNDYKMELEQVKDDALFDRDTLLASEVDNTLKEVATLITVLKPASTVSIH